MWVGLRHTTCKEITAGEMNQGLKGVFALSMTRWCSWWCERCTSSSPLPSTDYSHPPVHSHILQPSALTCLPGGSISKAAAQVSSAHREHGLTAPARGEEKHGFYRSACCTTGVTWKLQDINFEIILVYFSLSYILLIIIINRVTVNT